MRTSKIPSAMVLATAMFFTALNGRSDASVARYPAIFDVAGHLLDEETGRWTAEDVFGCSYVPLNKLETSLLAIVTIDLGATCVVPKPSSKEAWAIAKGERPPLARPGACEKPPGRILTSVRYGDGTQDRRAVPLSKFSAGSDGKTRIPFLFYRRSPCAPLELTVQTSTRSKPVRKKVDFACQD